MTLSLDEALSRPTISVPEAGAIFFNLGRNAAYEAAKRGDIPTIRVGGIIRVPVAPLAQKLGLQPNIGRTGRGARSEGEADG
ncbi:helix-turn-helix domain-containing protein [Chelativorans intermedius]|uniref:Helix-turn-helix domain-containing protein n=1 Tax=Chelativorans intermedius TaxID=515947 RepID=A0ABV6D7G5_9HYPH|nr:helix-turn-helix domain-containing protein [Chelativorans intermedius]MCT8999214.1 helix-turn-helix domain-containing protein [Chelativorans intermedius]